ncbi:MAG: glutamate racemase [Deltaproteobacteria bacterium]|nr:glutamate racemase [Deltaproteobacteria bacterium]
MDEARNKPIGVFDSGTGGLTVLRALRSRLPYEDIVYLGDTARLPFGTKSGKTVTSYAMQAARYLAGQGIKMLVVACNTASAVALEALEEAFPDLPVQGVVEPGAEAACRATKAGHVLVLGTESTVRGGAYQRAIARRRPDIRVQSRACQLFVSLAEEGWIDGPVVEGAAARYLDEFFVGPEIQAPDCVLFGCTHFPVLRLAVESVVGRFGVAIVDSAETTAEAVGQVLAGQGLEREHDHPGTTRFCVTDSPDRFTRVGRIFLGRKVDPDHVSLVDL